MEYTEKQIRGIKDAAYYSGLSEVLKAGATRHYHAPLEIIANGILEINASNIENNKPNYTKRDFMNTVLIFQHALTDKIFDIQEAENMPLEDRLNMVNRCGFALLELIKTYTGLDISNVKEFL